MYNSGMMSRCSFPWKRNEGFFSFSSYLRSRFGEKVFKIPLDLGLTCPNKDGTISTEGCLFCDEFGSGPPGGQRLDLDTQMKKGIARIEAKHKAKKYIAYFQANSNTAAPVGFLRQCAKTVLSYPGVVGISLGTRPDCISSAHFQWLDELSRSTSLWVELGLQTIRAEGLVWLRRHHTLEQFQKAFTELKNRCIPVCIHMILGIPGEEAKEAAAAADFISGIGADAVKIHPLHVLKGTALAELFQKGEYTPLQMEKYIELAVIFLEHLLPGIVIQRLTGERERALFLAPEWALNKNAVITAIRSRLKERDSFQGKLCNKSQG